MNRSFKWLGALSAAAVLGGIGWQLSTSTRDAGRTDADASRPRAEPAARCRLRLGEGASWATSLKTTRWQAGDLASAAAPAQGPRFTGTLTIEPVRAKSRGDGESFIVLARFTNVDAQTLEARPQFDHGFLLEVTDRCELVAFARAKPNDRLTARAQQSTVAGLWFRSPERDAEVASAEDGVGPYTAQLFREGRVVQRKMTGYTAAWQTGAPRPGIDDGFFSATLAPSGWFESVTSTLTLSGAPAMKTRFDLSLTPTAFEAAGLSGLSRDENEYVWENLLPVFDVPRPQAARPTFSEYERRQHEALREVSFERARDVFVSLLEHNQNVHEQWPIMARYLEAHPDEIPRYAKSLVSGEFASNRLGTAFLALGKAKVPEAREALLQIRTDSTVLPLSRHRAALALADRSDVGIELAKALRADAERVASTERTEGFIARNSALALGMLVGAQARPDDVKDEARTLIRDLLSRGKTKRDLSPAFGAMGNTGDPSYLSELAPFTRHPDPEVRAVASRGFRRLKPEQSEAFVTEWLSRETSPEVKREVFRVVYHQHLDAQQPVSEPIAHLAAAHLREQPYVLTRQSLVRILGPLAKQNAEAKAALLAQVRLEASTKSGLYDLISQYVDGDDVSRALHAPGGPLAEAAPAEPSKPRLPAPEVGAPGGFVTETP